MKCHPACPGLPWDRSEAQWRDRLFIIRSTESEWKRHPPLCHPERSRGICSSTDLSWKCFSTKRSVKHMKTYRIATVPGDGIGKEVVPAGRQVMEALGGGSFNFQFENFDWGGDYYR